MAEYIEREEVLSKAAPVEGCFSDMVSAYDVAMLPAADVAPVRHGSCEVCRGESVITQDCDNGYSIEVDAEQSELAVWYGDQCLAVFSIYFCPSCGAKMDEVLTDG